MGLFNRQKQEKETNIATTPEGPKPKKEFSKARFYYLLWTVLSMGFYCCYVFYLIVSVAQQYFLSKAILVLLIIYGALLVFIIIFSIGNKKKMKSRLKTYKSALNFLKYFIQLISFTLSIVNAISSFFVTGVFDRYSLLSAFTSLLITVIMVVFEIVKIMIRKNIPIVKNNFLKIKEKEDIEKQERYKQKQEYLEKKRNLKFIKKNKGLFNFEDDFDEDDYEDDLNEENNYQKEPQLDVSNNDSVNINDNTNNVNNDEQNYSYNEQGSVDGDVYFSRGEYKQEKKSYNLKTGLMKFLSKNKVDNYDDLNENKNNKKEEPTTSSEDFPVLSKNQEYDEYSGVIIDYEDGYDEDDYEDEEYYDEEMLKNKNTKKRKSSGFFRKFKK